MSISRTVICTLGMHRSGTSLIARVLNLLGVALGRDTSLAEAKADNPRGFWENWRVTDVNDKILDRFGGAWHAPPVLPPGWVDDPRIDSLRPAAASLIAREFAGASLWGWKDPRTCLTLPFWQRLVGPMRYVICLRNPREVAASLQDRNGFLPQHSQELWLTHVAASLAGTTHEPRLFVFYEDFLRDWRGELRRLAAFVGDPARADDPAIQAAVTAFIADDLRHQRVSPAALAADPAISFSTRSVYFALRGLRAHDEADAQAAAELIVAQFIDAGDRLNALPVVTAERDLARRIQATQAETIATLTRERDAAAATLAGHLDSVGWRSVTVGRKVIATVLPAGSKRRDKFTSLLRRTLS